MGVWRERWREKKEKAKKKVMTVTHQKHTWERLHRKTGEIWKKKRACVFQKGAERQSNSKPKQK